VTKFSILLASGLFWLAAGSVARADECATLADTLIPQTASSSYEDFDDTGWRTLASARCFLDSGKSIIAWLSTHQDSATDGQVRTLRYQAARVFAMTGRNRLAKVHLSHSKDPNQAVDAPQNWNAYIDAFSSWLDKDMTGLLSALDQLEAQIPDETGQKPQLIAARRFLVCFGGTYTAIEEDPACLKAAKEYEIPAVLPAPTTN